MQRAAEHRRSKAQLAEGQQDEHPSGKLPDEHSLGIPAQGTADISWWPRERVIGEGPWSKLPRWQPDLDSQSMSDHFAAKLKRMQASRDNKGGRYHGQIAATIAYPRQHEQQGSQRGSKHPWQLRRPHTAPSLLQELTQPLQTSSQAASHASCPFKLIKEGSRSQSTQHPTTLNPPVQPAKYTQRSTQQERSVTSHVVGQEPGRVVYVRLPSSQQQPRRAGRVPNFRELHAKWDARLAAAKAAMHKRRTVPRVTAPSVPGATSRLWC